MSVLNTLQNLGGCAGGIAVYTQARLACEASNATKPARSLKPATLGTLQCLFPQVDFKNVRYKTQCSLPPNWWPLNGQIDAMTFGNTIYIPGAFDQSAPDDFVLLAHECVHVAQFQRWGEHYDTFACNYGNGYLAGGGVIPAYWPHDAYHLNPLEAEAYNFETQFRDAAGAVVPANIPWAPRQGSAVDWLVPFAGGIITSFGTSGVYTSPDGLHLGGGGNTVMSYGGRAAVNRIVPFKKGALTAFIGRSTGNSWGIYSSADGLSLTGARAYDGQGIVSAMIPFQAGVMTSFFNPANLKPWGVYYSKNGKNPGGGSGTVVVYNGAALVDEMVPFRQGVVASFYNPQTQKPWGVYYSPDGLDLGGGGAGNTKLVYSGGYRVERMVSFAGGVLTAFYDPAHNTPKGVYLSPDGLNVGGGGATSLVYNSSARIDAMVAFKNGVVTSFFNPTDGKSWGIYASSDGKDLTERRIYGGENRARHMGVSGSNVFVALDGCGIYSSDGTSVGSLAQRVYP